jgi:hypothetical protein
VKTPKSLQQRRLHKAFLRYHDADNWPALREALKRMGRSDLIGYGKKHLVPPRQPAGWVPKDPKSRTTRTPNAARSPRKGSFRTQHTGLPPNPRDDS